MVSNATLAAVCVWAGLHEHLLFESHVLASDIQAYADNLKGRQEAEYARAQQEGRMPGQYWADVEPPKVGADFCDLLHMIGSLTFLPSLAGPLRRCRVYSRRRLRIRQLFTRRLGGFLQQDTEALL